MRGRRVSVDAISGGVFVAIGIAGLVLGGRLNVGSAAEMGEGYFPIALSGLLIAVGALVTAIGWRRSNDAAEPVRWRPLVWISLAVLAFALTIESLGVVVAVVLAVLLGSLATREARARNTLVTAVVLAILVLALFVWGLGLPLRALPRI